MTRHEQRIEPDDGPPQVSPEFFYHILTSACDIWIIISSQGDIKNIGVNAESRSLGCLDHWAGRNLRDFLTEESVGKLEKRLAAFVGAQKSDAPVGVELNHVDNANWEFPVRYTLHPTGVDDDILLAGRDLRQIAETQQQLVKTQLSLEKDYERYRGFETRFRVLLEKTRDAMVLVTDGGRIQNANSAAAQLLGADVETLTGAAFTQAFDDRQRAAFLEELRRSAAAETDGAVAAQSRRNRRQILIYPTLFRSAGDVLLICRLEAADKSRPASEALREELHELFLNGSEAIVFTDSRGVIRHANEAFLAICDLPLAADAKDRSFAEFLVRGGVDLKVLMDNSAQTGRLRTYATKTKSAFGAECPVEISATCFSGRVEPSYAFVLRDATASESGRDVAFGDEAARNAMQLVGSAPLKDLVSATSDVVEKLCIETALELTRNNRVAAAEMLSLSRQSLYVKLRKYGLLSRDFEDDGAA